MRRAARVDENQQAVIAALAAAGCTVQPLHTVGQGVPDLLVGRAGKTYLMEVKDGKKQPSARKLRQTQVDWHAWWQGSPAVTVKNVDEALAALLGIEVVET